MRKYKLKEDSFKSKIFIFFIIVLLSCFFPIYSLAQQDIKSPGGKTTHNIGKSLQQELDEIKQQLEANRTKQSEYKSQISALQAESSRLNNEIPILENEVYLLNEEIAELNLVLKELEIQINILIAEIQNLEEQILDAEDQIEQLEKETDDRLKNMYLSQKQNSSTSSALFSSDGPSALVKTDAYRYAMQKDTNEKLEALEKIRLKLEIDKQKVEEDKIEVDKNRKKSEEQKIALDQKKYRAEQQKALYMQKVRESGQQITDIKKLMEFLSEEEKELLARYDQIQNALLARNEVANGMKVSRGDFLGIEGNTGYSYGAHLHFGVSVDGVIQNPCTYLSAYGCGGNGKLATPLSGAVLTSGFRTSSRPSHNAIDVSAGGGGTVVAAHDGYAYFFFEPCPSWAPVCNNGGAIVAKVCEVDGCGSGFTTVYYHLSCTAEPSDSPRSCN
ncbi:peptidoglycan DD-metalloendopeptidase family protein [Candidatus Dojkabacteria bacterium]|nr:peptidoglycan DD-metalloendopeptidase family protein [Candidatus Dojkabacteria bacterium]